MEKKYRDIKNYQKKTKKGKKGTNNLS